MNKKRILTQATNTGHFSWIVAQLDQFEAGNGWLFAYRSVGDVVLLAFEPLPPEGRTELEWGEAIAGEFNLAWSEFRAFVGGRHYAFIGVGEACCRFLNQRGFGQILIGREPWVDLKFPIPTGNSGLGVRNSRNQAIRAGLSVQERPINDAPEIRRLLGEIQDSWRQKRLVSVEGFILKIDPFQAMETRRYFGIHSRERIEGFAIVSPVGGIQATYLEDMICRKGAHKGAGELLVTEVMRKLGAEGFREISLGTVECVGELDALTRKNPAPLRLLLNSFRRVSGLFYSGDGIKLFRSRFKPHRWGSVYIAVSPGSSWARVAWSVVRAIEPKFKLRWTWVREEVRDFFAARPITTALFGISSLVFIFANLPNHGALLNPALLERGSVQFAAAWYEWPYRIVASDFLYQDFFHFIATQAFFLAFVPYAEKKYPRWTLVPVVLTFMLLDDIVNFWLIAKPVEVLYPKLFSLLVVERDVGGSLVALFFVGVRIFGFQKVRDYVLPIAVFGVAFTLGLLSSSNHLFLLNLNHLIALSAGYLFAQTEKALRRETTRRSILRWIKRPFQFG